MSRFRLIAATVATLVLPVVGHLTAAPAADASPITYAAPASQCPSGPKTPTTPPKHIPEPICHRPVTTVAVGPPPVAAFPAPATAAWPRWKVTADGVPYYRGRPACTLADATTIAQAFRNAGASVSTARWAVYVASREGGCNYQAVRVVARTHDASYCTFQLNAARGGPLSPSGLLGRLGFTPATVTSSLSSCAAAAVALWSACGKGPWIRGDYSCHRPNE